MKYPKIVYRLAEEFFIKLTCDDYFRQFSHLRDRIMRKLNNYGRISVKNIKPYTEAVMIVICQKFGFEAKNIEDVRVVINYYDRKRLKELYKNRNINYDPKKPITLKEIKKINQKLKKGEKRRAY